MSRATVDLLLACAGGLLLIGAMCPHGERGDPRLQVGARLERHDEYLVAANEGKPPASPGHAPGMARADRAGALAHDSASD